MIATDALIDELEKPGWMINEDRMAAVIARLRAGEKALHSARNSDSVMEQEADYAEWKRLAGKSAPA